MLGYFATASEADAPCFPVDHGIMFLQPRHTEDKWIGRGAYHFKRDHLLMAIDL